MLDSHNLSIVRFDGGIHFYRAHPNVMFKFGPLEKFIFFTYFELPINSEQKKITENLQNAETEKIDDENDYIQQCKT